MASSRDSAKAQRNAGTRSRSERRGALKRKESRASPGEDPRRSAGIPTRLGAFGVNILECAWLTALAVVPSFLNLYSEWTFEEEKVLVLRSLAILMTARPR